MSVAALPPTFTPSCPVVVEIGESPDDWCLHDATVTSCVFSRRAQTTPVSEQQEVFCFRQIFGILVLLSQAGGGGVYVVAAVDIDIDVASFPPQMVDILHNSHRPFAKGA